MDTYPRQDNDLINDIKKHNSNESFIELITRHTPLCYDMYRKFTPALTASGVCINELVKEKDYIFYKSVLSFDASKNVKFTTWLSNHLRYQCLNAINPKKNNLIAIGDEEVCAIADKAHTDNKAEVKSEFDYVTSILDQMTDKRIKTIFFMRHINTGNKNKTPWAKVAKKLKLTVPAVINLYSKGRKMLKQKLKSEQCFDKI